MKNLQNHFKKLNGDKEIKVVVLSNILLLPYHLSSYERSISHFNKEAALFNSLVCVTSILSSADVKMIEPNKLMNVYLDLYNIEDALERINDQLPSVFKVSEEFLVKSHEYTDGEKEQALFIEICEKINIIYTILCYICRTDLESSAKLVLEKGVRNGKE